MTVFLISIVSFFTIIMVNSEKNKEKYANYIASLFFTAIYAALLALYSAICHMFSSEITIFEVSLFSMPFIYLFSMT